jgi:hypothetical protein
MLFRNDQGPSVSDSVTSLQLHITNPFGLVHCPMWRTPRRKICYLIEAAGCDGKFVVSKTREAYDALTKGPNRKICFWCEWEGGGPRCGIG